jgi:hypothetical protein
VCSTLFSFSGKYTDWAGPIDDIDQIFVNKIAPRSQLGHGTTEASRLDSTKSSTRHPLHHHRLEHEEVPSAAMLKLLGSSNDRSEIVDFAKACPRLVEHTWSGMWRELPGVQLLVRAARPSGPPGVYLACLCDDGASGNWCARQGELTGWGLFAAVLYRSPSVHILHHVSVDELTCWQRGSR